MVKDHRTNCENGNINTVMDGDLMRICRGRREMFEKLAVNS